MSRAGLKVSTYIVLGVQLVFTLQENYLLWNFSSFLFKYV